MFFHVNSREKEAWILNSSWAYLFNKFLLLWYITKYNCAVIHFLAAAEKNITVRLSEYKK